ncbi:agrocinopine synthase (plasmid) [Sinorhizobium meliloti]|uniref:agrocinopine synthase n=1 Tax=Rhizobium meliloti TaxID=382 RepID=UPI000B49D030|nr:agrocinopine synthase [Sinorhizobium meliloti]ASP89596.1 agrocinopine synthase [Sinorhizobium meliloti]MQW28544.1 agrocinopine synthase [Sinorhizobium meliloti]
MYDLGKGVQECTRTSVVAALGPAGKRNLTELDIALTCDNVPAAFHEFNPWRVSLLPDTLVRNLHSNEVQGAQVIIRDFVRGKHSETYTQTDDVIELIEPLLDHAFEVNPCATIFLDGREFEAHIITSWLSHRTKYHQRVILLFYTFKYANGKAFAEAVEQENPALSWRKTVALTPVIFPDELPKLAKHFGLGDFGVDDLYAAGKFWIDSILEQSMRTVAIQIMMARVKPCQIDGCHDPSVKKAFNADYAAVNLAKYVKNDPDVRQAYPHLKLSTGTRAYAFSSKIGHGEQGYFTMSLLSGREIPWETDERRYIRQGYATPGNAAEIADWVISDRSEDDMALWQWRDRGINREVDFRYPPLDAIEASGT